MPEEAPEGFELRYTEGDNLPYYQKIADIPSEPSDSLNNDPFARAASRMRRSVVHDRLPVQGRSAPETPPNYLMGPDLLEAQQGQNLPTDTAVNDAGIPFNLKTGAEIPTVRRPNVLPVTMTQEGPRWAMPKMLDVAGNLMGGVAAPAVATKAGEVVLGSGAVRKMVKLTPVEGNPFAMDEASRLARANEQGFDTSNTLYHQTKSNIDEFKLNSDPNSHSGGGAIWLRNDPSQSLSAHQTGMAGNLVEGANEIPVFIKHGNELMPKDYSALKREGKLSPNFPEFVTMADNKMLSDLGYTHARRGSEVAVFDPKNIRSKFAQFDPTKADGGNILYSDTRNQVYAAAGHELEKPNQPFFSALESAVDNAKLSKGSADQWLGYLKNQPGVKAEELSTVLGDLKGGSLSKEQVQDAVKNNKVELGEKVRGEPILKNAEKEFDAAVGDGVPWGKGKLYSDELKRALIKEDLTPADLPENLQSAAKNLIQANKDNIPTKYHGYQLPGESSNYKEMLLTLPEKKLPNPGNYSEFAKSKGYTDDQIKDTFHKFKDPVYREWQEKNDAFFESLSSGFKSYHWDEPNIIAHIRHNDRTVEGKKTLHLEELQSDWHQKGRKEGYKLSEKQKADLDSIENKLTTKLTEAEIGNPDIDNVLKVAVDKKVISADDAKNYKEYVKGENSTVPDAPFKKNWDELALKRMLHHAAVNDYHGLSWTPGEAQAARYDLSKSVDNIQWKPEHGKNLVEINPKGGKQIGIYVDEKGNVIPNEGYDVHAKPYEGKNLSDIVGKEVAEKIFKKMGEAKPYEPITKLPEGYGLIRDRNGSSKSYPWGEWGITSPDEKSAKSFTGRYHATEEEAKNAAIEILNQNAKRKHDAANSTLEGEGLKIGGEGMKTFYDKMLVDRASNLIKKYGGKVEQKEIETDKIVAGANAGKRAKMTVPYIEMTPALKEKAKAGFPLFSSTPVLSPVQHNPFASEDQKRYTLVPVKGNPFQ